MDSVKYVDPKLVRQFIVDLFGKLEVSPEDAGAVADNLIDAEIRGVTTHGLTRIQLYIDRIETGFCDVKGAPEIVKDFGATAVIDAHNNLGQIASVKAMELAIEKADRFGVGFVGVRNNCHYGTAGFYAMMAEKKGMIGLSTTNSGVFVAPYGGIEHRLGTNPVAVAIPAKKHLPILLDMATSRVSRGKVLVNMKKGIPVPEDWALGPDGHPTTDAEKAFAGILLPLSYKGYGMAVVIDMLAGILMGSGFGNQVDRFTEFPHVGSNFMAIRTDAFCELGEFESNVDALIDEIKATPLSEEIGQDKIYMPGEIEFEIEAENMKNGGVPLQEFQINELKRYADRYHVSYDYLF